MCCYCSFARGVCGFCVVIERWKASVGEKITFRLAEMYPLKTKMFAIGEVCAMGARVNTFLYISRDDTLRVRGCLHGEGPMCCAVGSVEACIKRTK